jgi:hypothetical protein
MLKHVGRHGDRKVAIIFREIPGEDHMCLVIYPDVLPVAWHDAIMKVVESDVGQQAEELADALHRSYLPDGRVILDTLHTERMIKKVRTADVLMKHNKELVQYYEMMIERIGELRKSNLPPDWDGVFRATSK